MPTTHFNNHPHYVQTSGSVNSHLLSLQCVLDKYQHQNELLTHKIAFLLQQNQKLRDHSHNNQFHIPKVHHHQKHPNFNQPKNNIIQNINTQLDPSGQNHRNLSMKKKGFRIPVSITASQIPLPKTIDQELLEDQNMTQRIGNIGKNKIERYVKREKYFNEGIFNGQDFETRIENENDKLTQTKGKKRTKIWENLSPRKIIRIKKFTREVYLEAETFYDECSSERLPTFVEPSFGNEENKGKFVEKEKYEKQERQREVYYEQIEQYKIKKQRQNIEKGLARVKISQTQKQEILREKQCFIEQQRKKQQQKLHLTHTNKQFFQATNGKKTNYPYIDTDFKVAQPSAQGSKGSRREVREIREWGQGREGRVEQKKEKSVAKINKSRRTLNKIGKAQFEYD